MYDVKTGGLWSMREMSWYHEFGTLCRYVEYVS